MTQIYTDHGSQHVNLHHFNEQSPVQPTRSIQTDVVFGSVFFEVILTADTPPAVPGWTLRLWSQARLKDATLEAAPGPADQGQDVDDLLRGLQAQGIQALGPVRHRRN